MDEAELRRLADAALALLHLLVPQAAEAERVRHGLVRALALPPGGAEIELLGALTAHSAMKRWLSEHTQRRQYRKAQHYLSAEAPERVPVGFRFSVLVQVMGAPRAQGLSAALSPWDVRKGDSTLTLTVSAPHLEPLGHLRQEVHVPTVGASAPVEFGFRSIRPGLHPLVVHAFADGTFLGEVTVQISVQTGVGVDPGQPRSEGLRRTEAEPGAVTLEVSRTLDDRYSFRLIAAGTEELELSQRLAGDPRRVLAEIIDELRLFARHRSLHTTPQGRRNRLRNLGVDLWSQAVPEAIRSQFWALGDGIKTFRVLSRADALPWELLYPLDGLRDRGFLVDQFPVIRQVEQQQRLRHVPLRSAAFVLPPGAPRDATEEARLIQERLGDLPVLQPVTSLAELTALLAAPPGVLHFACHNEFTDDAGAILHLDQGPFRPSDLSVAVQRRSLSWAAPIVFLNACRTADEIPGLTRPMGWARQFMAAGAGAFLGTLWPVRSEAALDFAVAFYESFVGDRRALGEAVAQARSRVATKDDGDPTWLAYTVYGDPDTTVRDPVRDPTPESTGYGGG